MQRHVAQTKGAGDESQRAALAGAQRARVDQAVDLVLPGFVGAGILRPTAQLRQIIESKRIEGPHAPGASRGPCRPRWRR
eukprot:COSAG04_NODE_325_length_16785_cov_23.851792_10_plen_80_part_00